MLGITSTQLAHKLNRSQQSISRLEQAERNQSTTLKSLQQAAQALDCQLVYALIPKKSIHHTLNEKAFQKAQKERNACAHTMRGEQQDVHPHPLKKLIKQHAQKMLEHPNPFHTHLSRYNPLQERPISRLSNKPIRITTPL